MKVRISDLPAQGLQISDTISVANLNKRMQEGRNNDIIFLNDPQVDIIVTPRIGGAEVSGRVNALYKQPCALCAEELEQKLNVTVEVELKPRQVGAEELDDDVGILIYTGEHVDLEAYLQEALILKLTPYLQPERDEDDKCRLCGKACLQAAPAPIVTGGISLGELIKTAQPRKQQPTKKSSKRK